MKRKNFFKLIGSGSLALALGGCSDFLDVVPEGKATKEDAFSTVSNAEDYLYSIYHFLPNPTSVRNSIDLLTTDEISDAWDRFNSSHFKRGNYSPNNLIISDYNNFYKGIRQAYILVNNVDTVPELPEVLKKRYKAEAKFLIGYFYYRLIRAYGPAVIHEDVVDINKKQEHFGKRSSLEESVKFVSNLLDDVVKDLPKIRSGSEYGRATSTAAKAIKAKLLLYAASPLFNGGGENMNSLYTDFKDKDGIALMPSTYDKNKWRKAADALKRAISAAESAGHQLYIDSSVDAPQPSDPVEKDLRFTLCDENSNEIIFPETGYTNGIQNNSEPRHRPVDKKAYGGVSPSLEMVELFYSENGLPIDKDPDFDYNNRYSIVNGLNGPTMAVNLHREPRFNAWISFHNGWYELRYSNAYRIITQYRSHDADGRRGREGGYSATGYLNKKGVHPLSRGDKAHREEFPWSYLRLADLYLLYAEALIESDKDLSTAKNYIDKVRERAGIPTIDQSWAPIGGADDKETLRSIVRRERTIEFYMENQRFWDLRRWMMGDKLDIQPTGMNVDGATNKEFFKVVDSSYKLNFYKPSNYLLPIPFDEVLNNPNIVQNPGY